MVLPCRQYTFALILTFSYFTSLHYKLGFGVFVSVCVNKTTSSTEGMDTAYSWNASASKQLDFHVRSNGSAKMSVMPNNDTLSVIIAYIGVNATISGSNAIKGTVPDSFYYRSFSDFNHPLISISCSCNSISNCYPITYWALHPMTIYRS